MFVLVKIEKPPPDRPDGRLIWNLPIRPGIGQRTSPPFRWMGQCPGVAAQRPLASPPPDRPDGRFISGSDPGGVCQSGSLGTASFGACLPPELALSFREGGGGLRGNLGFPPPRLWVWRRPSSSGYLGDHSQVETSGWRPVVCQPSSKLKLWSPHITGQLSQINCFWTNKIISDWIPIVFSDIFI
jgi:hypothetical protein